MLLSPAPARTIVSTRNNTPPAIAVRLFVMTIRRHHFGERNRRLNRSLLNLFFEAMRLPFCAYGATGIISIIPTSRDRGVAKKYTRVQFQTLSKCGEYESAGTSDELWYRLDRRGS